VEATGSLILWDALCGVYDALGFAAVDDEAFRRGRVDRRASSASTVRAAVLDPAGALLAGWRNRWREQPQTGRFPLFQCTGDPRAGRFAGVLADRLSGMIMFGCRSRPEGVM
jgi:hypothetical protein